MSFLGQEEQVRELQDRFRTLYTVLFLGLGLIASRLVYLQILKGDTLRRYSEENRIKRVKIPAPRGMIFDQNRTLLIDNRPAFDLEITPQYLRESGQSREVVKLIAQLLKMKESEIDEKLDKAKNQPSFMPIKIKTDLTRDEVAKIETWRVALPGVSVEMEIKRTNVFGDVASHFLGYIGAVTQTELPKVNAKRRMYEMGDSIGKFGIEKQHEETLRGIDGQELVEVDALGRRIQSQAARRSILVESPETQATPGKNLILTIDQDLQQAAKEAFGEKVGAMVAIDPKTGEILAMMSRPSFDPTEFSRGISPERWKQLLDDENRPLRDKVLQDHYSPGSTFKIITGIAGLEEGVVDENSTFLCTGSMRVGNRIYHCHKKGGHGPMNIVNAIIQSCDTYFYRVSQKLKSVDDIAHWATLLGLGQKTKIDLPRETIGLIPTEEWKQKRFGQPWNAGETLSVAIGQSFVLTTAIQLANSYAAIANGGTIYKPHYIRQVEDSDGKIIKAFGPEVLGQAKLKLKTIELIKKGLWGVVNTPRGTAYPQRLPGMDFVGKTGTVQVIRIAKEKIYSKCENMRFNQRHHGVFVGFAPMDNPRIAVAVIAEHSCHGSTGAAPIARAVIQKYLEKKFPSEFGPEVIAAKTKGAEKPQRSAKPADDEDIFVDAPDSSSVVPELPGADEAPMIRE